MPNLSTPTHAESLQAAVVPSVESKAWGPCSSQIQFQSLFLGCFSKCQQRQAHVSAMGPCLCLRTARACTHKPHPGIFSSFLLTLTQASPVLPHSWGIRVPWECFSTSVRGRDFKEVPKIWTRSRKSAPVLRPQVHREIHSWTGESSKGPAVILSPFPLKSI